MTKATPPAQRSGHSKTWLIAVAFCVAGSTAAVYSAVERKESASTASASETRTRSDRTGKNGQAATATETEEATSPNVAKVAGTSKWKRVWSDEFTGTGLPDKTKWTPVLGGGKNGWSHKSLHYYTAESNRLNGKGQLVISAAKVGSSAGLTCWYGPCKYTSGRVQTSIHFSQTYGRFAVRMKLPGGKGIWPAFWMQSLAKPYGEIDVAETIGSKPNLVQGFAHGTKRVAKGSVDMKHSLATRYHIYGVDWSPKGIVWWVDGKPYLKMKSYRKWPFDHPFQLILNVQVGGEWPGSPDATVKFPARMTVDWVRVYRRK